MSKLDEKISDLLVLSIAGSQKEQKSAEAELEILSQDKKSIFTILSRLLANPDTPQILKSSAAFHLRQTIRKAIECNELDSEVRHLLFNSISAALVSQNLDTVTKGALQYSLNLVITGEWIESLKPSKEKLEENKASSVGKKSAKKSKESLQFSAQSVSKIMKKFKITKRIGSGAPVYLAAVLEFLASEMLELAGNAAKDYKKSRIVPKHIQFAIRKNKELSKLIMNKSIEENIANILERQKKDAETHEH
ncbi:unnamed protein product [Blepharisma stoltei]|uniref:Histone H2A n=1 Tax=Blepharisma stoltei TaxID=1481888 RepID=A0AAU9KC16_9CILI|nr:unnamed protein product [Blepharisma stoltei]